ncbi:hypothetical protein GOOTI_031_00170 [Gordonia otitidis NBRC 100426]|uniref:Uncharacterized protein n=1 Tax=Gordonia otitidis (strain DSM 44809 / CCUG 52243 / JCM 12355 / NBRC 100426 / IFM 10032) TaxID=1108044 RepID=H5THB1_GORO1|nr:hypothetical protein GOOTI_031_00170 [Gordonia otitidis NBRC 100426]
MCPQSEITAEAADVARRVIAVGMIAAVKMIAAVGIVAIGPAWKAEDAGLRV